MIAIHYFQIVDLHDIGKKVVQTESLKQTWLAMITFNIIQVYKTSKLLQ